MTTPPTPPIPTGPSIGFYNSPLNVGRPVYKKDEGAERYLLTSGPNGLWTVLSNLSQTGSEEIRSVAPSLSPASSEISGWQFRDNQTQWVDANIRVEKAITDNYAVGVGFGVTAMLLGVIFLGVAVILFRNRGGKKNRKDVQYHYTIHEDEK